MLSAAKYVLRSFYGNSSSIFLAEKAWHSGPLSLILFPVRGRWCVNISYMAD